jgi:hypothetical protein
MIEVNLEVEIASCFAPRKTHALHAHISSSQPQIRDLNEWSRPRKPVDRRAVDRQRRRPARVVMDY